MHSLGKRAYCKRYREFESPPLRIVPRRTRECPRVPMIRFLRAASAAAAVLIAGCAGAGSTTQCQAPPVAVPQPPVMLAPAPGASGVPASATNVEISYDPPSRLAARRRGRRNDDSGRTVLGARLPAVCLTAAVRRGGLLAARARAAHDVHRVRRRELRSGGPVPRRPNRSADVQRRNVHDAVSGNPVQALFFPFFPPENAEMPVATAARMVAAAPTNAITSCDDSSSVTWTNCISRYATASPALLPR